MSWASRALQGQREKVAPWVPQDLLVPWESRASRDLWDAEASTAHRGKWALLGCPAPAAPRDPRACRAGVAPLAPGALRVQQGWRDPLVPKETRVQMVPLG